ncbi:MAG: adenosine deaminase, partial [Solobacterium sp.]|nr:adenosine deaminase [Solobacterium sp.]
DEYAHCIDDMGFTVDDIFQMNINAVNAAFVTEEERKELLHILETARKEYAPC